MKQSKTTRERSKEKKEIARGKAKKIRMGEFGTFIIIHILHAVREA